MNRGDHRQDLFRGDHDRRLLLSTLGEVCVKADWQVHAWCLLRNHFHLVLETPQPNLVAGMKWLLGIYTKQVSNKTCARSPRGLDTRSPSRGDCAERPH